MSKTNSNEQQSHDKNRTPTIFVRVEADVKDWIKSWSHELTERQVVDNVLRYFKSLDREAQMRIFAESGDSPSGAGFGEAIEMTAWAEHAFSRFHWDWSLEEWQGLAAKTGGINGLQRLAHYHIFYCYLEIALSLRKEIIAAIGDVRTRRVHPSMWTETYRGADNAIRLGIKHLDEFERRGGQHPVVTYGTGCAYSLRAQFVVEHALTWKSPLILALHDVIHGKDPIDIKVLTENDHDDEPERESGGRMPSPEEMVWSAIGKRWRNEIPAKTKIEKDEKDALLERVGGYAASSMRYLETVKNWNTAPSSRRSILNTGFLIRLSRVDSDLTFLRCDKTAQKEFRRWLLRYSEVSRLASFERHLTTLDPSVQDWLKADQETFEP
jgi:hypothetical protein